MQEIINDLALPTNILPQIIATIITLVLNPSTRYVSRKFVRHTGLLSSKSELRVGQISRLLCMSINVLTMVILAIIWGVEPRHMFLVISSVFTVVGVAMFAQWSILSNITAGIVIFFSMPFKLGDEIEILDKDYPIKATVENIVTFAIHLRKEDGSLVVMSNTLFLQKVFSIADHK